MRANLYLRFRKNFYLVLLLLAPGMGLFSQASDPSIFRDDFNENVFGNFWLAHPSWSIVNGTAFNLIDGAGGILKTAEYFSETSYIIETRVMGFNTDYYREFRLTFGQADLSDDELYQLKYTGYGGGRLTLSRSSDNIYFPQVLDEAAIFPAFNSSRWYNLKIAKYESGLIQVFIDNGSGYDSIPFLEAIDLTYPNLGHAGWQVDTQASPQGFYVDWISAYKPDTEKPAIKEKPAEDNLIIQVYAKSGNDYKVNKIDIGVRQLIDRDYTLTTVPEYLKGASFIQTANDDKTNSDDDFLTFFVKRSAIIYIGYDSRSTTIPEWLTQWTRTGDRIALSDEKAGYLNIYSKLVEGSEVYPYPVILGGNSAKPAVGAKTNYLVAAVEVPGVKRLQAEDALLSGPVVARNHSNYHGSGFVDFKNLFDDYIEWTVQIDVPGTYNTGFRFANASLGERSLQISDNGVDAGIATFIPISTSWSSWAFLSGPTVFLSAGVHKIRLTATGTSGPNIDELSLIFVSKSPTSLAKNYLVSPEVPGKLREINYKAYPNPFLQTTSIYYEVKNKARVMLSVYNLQGQQIQLLLNAIQAAGSYSATFNSDKFAKGIYFFRLQIGNEIRKGKLIKE
ncbi:MAG: T9SS type A sorting domain-containing protein [Ginsengibacter sp.]